MRNTFLSTLALAGLLMAQSASALNLPVNAGWERGDAGSMYAEWNQFGDVSNNAPDVGSIHVGQASLSETSGASFVTGGGNIYGFGAPAQFELGLTGGAGGPALGDTVDVYLQIVTQGTALDAGSVVLNGLGGTGGLVSSVSLGGFGGALETYLFSWTLSVVDQWLFSFNALEPHLSLDSVALDFGTVAVSEVPLPASAWLFASGLLGLASARKRRFAEG